MSHHQQPGRVSTAEPSRPKRKERETLLSPKPPPPPTATAAGAGTTQSKAAESVFSNRLLAGYMAYEFLTKGTLFGQKFGSARAEPGKPDLEAGADQWKDGKKPPKDAREGAEPSGREKPKPKPKQQSYAEVAGVLMADGTHFPGIVNPAHLARWLQM